MRDAHDRLAVGAAGGTPVRDPDAFVAHYVARLDGPESEDALHSLLEAGPQILPQLSATFDRSASPRIRAQLVRIMGQARVPGAVDALANALRDRASEVWKAALDGLVTIGGPASEAVLQSALASAGSGEYEVPVDWLAEALDQVKER